jgi:hypothetical protein
VTLSGRAAAGYTVKRVCMPQTNHLLGGLSPVERDVVSRAAQAVCLVWGGNDVIESFERSFETNQTYICLRAIFVPAAVRSVDFEDLASLHSLLGPSLLVEAAVSATTSPESGRTLSLVLRIRRGTDWTPFVVNTDHCIIMQRDRALRRDQSLAPSDEDEPAQPDWESVLVDESSTPAEPSIDPAILQRFSEEHRPIVRSLMALMQTSGTRFSDWTARTASDRLTLTGTLADANTAVRFAVLHCIRFMHPRRMFRTWLSLDMATGHMRMSCCMLFESPADVAATHRTLVFFKSLQPSTSEKSASVDNTDNSERKRSRTNI